MRLLLIILFASASILLKSEVPKFTTVSAYPTGSASYTAATYGANTFVAVGNSNIVYSIDDGVNWFEAQGYPKIKFLDVLFAGGRFVAVGEGAQSATSLDGITWTTYQLSQSKTLRSLAYGNGTFAVAANGSSGLSIDGASWSFTLPSSVGVAFANGQFLFSRDISGVPTSSRGYTNTSAGTSSPVLSFGDTFYIVVHYPVPQWHPIIVLYSSSNSSTWSEIDPPSGGGTEIQIFSTGRRMLSVASGLGPNRTSTIAGNGPSVPHPGLVRLADIVESDTSMVAVGPIVIEGYPSISRFSWTSSQWLNTAPPEIPIKAGAYSRNLYVGVGSTNKSGNLIPQIVTATNGLPSLTLITPPEGTAALNAIRHADGKFVAVGNAGTIIRSTDGVNWTRRLSNTSSDLYDITYANGLWIAVGANGKIVTSTDASVFGLRFSGTEVAINGITHGNGQFVAVGKDGLIVTSPNGIDWTANGTEEAKTLNSVAFGNGVFIAVGTNGITHLSSNAVNWVAIPIPNASNFRRIAHAHGTFVALTSANNIIYATTNGIDWSSEQISTFNLTGLDSSDGELWLTGEKSTILKTSLTPPRPTTLSASLTPAKELTLTLDPGTIGTYVIESTPSLNVRNWQPVVTFSNINTITLWTETNLYLYRYYRARRQ